MGVGGATWDDAGALSLGSGNTFDLADAAPGGPYPRHRAWWMYTPPVPVALTVDTFASVYTGGDPFKADTNLSIYSGALEVDAVEVDYTDEQDDAGGAHVWLSTVTAWLSAGVTYHIRAGEWWGDPDNAITDYVLTASVAPLTVTPWNDALQDDDNYLIVGSLLDQNLPVWGSDPRDWYDEIVRTGPGRRGHYRVQGALGGAAVNTTDAYDCTMSHAFIGDQNSQVWNADGFSPDPTDPVCWVLPTAGTEADADTERESTSREIVYNPGIPPFIGPDTQADVTGSSFGMWFLAARSHLPPSGVLTEPFPEDYGYPADAQIEWEDPEVELVHVDVTDGAVVGSGTAPYTNQWFLNSEYAPHWISGFGATPWDYGAPASAGSDLTFDYDDGTETWHTVPDTNGWDGHGWQEDFTGPAPDEADGVMIVWPDSPLTGPGSEARDAVLAVKYVLLAPRFRFIYAGDVPESVVRQYPRDNNQGWGSGTRLYPPTKAERVIGGLQ